MASHPHDFGRASALPLSAALAIIPSLPRPLLSRLVARAIERLDEIDGDPDLEPDDPGEDNGDAEQEQGRAAIYGVDQSRGPVRCARASDLEQPHERRLPWTR
jgi:hypothetical protein